MAKPNLLSLDFSQQKVASQFLRTIATGKHPLIEDAHVDEILALGPRGEGKTIGVLAGMVTHAGIHQQYGFPLPVPWLSVRDTFANHRMTTCKTLEKPLWQGMWKSYDQEKLWIAYQRPEPNKPPQEMVELRLTGLEDQAAKEKLKQEIVGLHFEEAAPSAGLVTSMGIDDSSWDLAVTSCRVPSHFKPKVVTQNYPDEDHWTWERWKPSKTPVFCNAGLLRELMEIAGIDSLAVNEAMRLHPEGTKWYDCIGTSPDASERIWFRVPAGERASAEDRKVWAKALKERPDLFVRLILGLPGQVQLGEPVARTGLPGGYDPRAHIASEELKVLMNEPIKIGFDFGHTPTAIIGQSMYGGVRVHAGLWIDGGMQQLLDYEVMPWFARFAPWARKNPNLIEWGYDPTGSTGDQSDIDRTAVKAIQMAFGGGFGYAGPIRWDDRKNALLTALARREGLLISPNPYTSDLRKALESKWIYPKDHRGDLKSDIPKKPNHPWEDLGDGLIYLLAAAGIGNWGESTEANQATVRSVHKRR